MATKQTQAKKQDAQLKEFLQKVAQNPKELDEEHARATALVYESARQRKEHREAEFQMDDYWMNDDNNIGFNDAHAARAIELLWSKTQAAADEAVRLKRREQLKRNDSILINHLMARSDELKGSRRTQLSTKGTQLGTAASTDDRDKIISSSSSSSSTSRTRGKSGSSGGKRNYLHNHRHHPKTKSL